MQFEILNFLFNIIVIGSGIILLVWIFFRTKLELFFTRFRYPILFFFLLTSIILIILSSFNRFISIDEIEHLHSSWYIYIGKIPYADFFEQHHPFLWYILKPLFLTIGENTKIIFYARAVMLFFTLGIIFLTYTLGKILFNKYVGFLSALFLSYTALFLDASIEIRPDVPQTFFVMIGLILFFLFFKRQKEKYIILSFISFGLAFLFLQKIIFLILIFFLILHKFSKNSKILLLALGSFSLSIFPYYLYLLLSHSFTVYFLNTWLSNFFLPGRGSVFEAMKLSLIENTFFWILFIFGIWHLLRSSEKTLFLFSYISLGIFLNIFLFKFPAKQYFIIFFPLMAIISAYAFTKLVHKYNLSQTNQIGAVFIIIFIPFFLLMGNAVPNNKKHIEKIQFIIKNTKPTDKIADLSVRLNIFRPDVGYFWYAIEPFMISYKKFSPQNYDICRLIDEKKPKIYVSNELSKCTLYTKYDATIYSEIFLLRDY